MTSKVHNKSNSNLDVDIIFNREKNLNSSTSSRYFDKNENEDNFKSLNNKESNINNENVKIKLNNINSLNVLNDSDSTLVRNSNTIDSCGTIKSNSNKKRKSIYYNAKESNEIIEIEDRISLNSDMDRENTITQNDVFKGLHLNRNSISSFKTAFSHSSDTSFNSVNTFQTGKTSTSQPTEGKKKSITSLKSSTSILTLAPKNINALTSKESTKLKKKKHAKKENDININSISFNKIYKSRNSSKDFTSYNQQIPNHLMNNENNNKTNFKKDEGQKLSISSLSITKGHSLKKQSKAIENIIGTPIKKDHVHYILMLDMLNGIRYSVQRCNASTHREIYLKDFKAKHKIALDVYNNELLPSSKYYYKFKDYAPRVFKSIREICKISSEEYLISLTGKYMLTEIDSPGKSGSFFYYSQDYRYIIKTVHHTEHKYLLKILKNYYFYLKKNPNTLICKIFGLHRVKIQHGKKIHFIIMENIFPPDKDIHEKYDLKGSLVGRYTSEKMQNINKLIILKDLNWVKKERKIYLGKEKSDILIRQLEKDVKFLAENNVMDYSLLVGCHNLNKGNKDNIRDSTLSIIEPNPESLNNKRDSKRKSKKDPMAIALARAIAETEPVSLETSNSTLPDFNPKHKKHFIFNHDDGGFRATDENNKELQEIYFLGIIDIFTSYNMKKKLEYLCKSIINNKKNISSVNPSFYSKRFLDFIKNSIGQDLKVNRLKNLKPNPKQLQNRLKKN